MSGPRALRDRLDDVGDPLTTEASEELGELESEVDSLRDKIGVLEDQADRRSVADLEGSRLCGPCGFGTIVPEAVFCTGCGSRRWPA